MTEIIMGTDALRLFKENVGDEAYVETPSGKFTPITGILIFSDCRIRTNSVYYDWPISGEPHVCTTEEPCSAELREAGLLYVSGY